MYCAYFVSIYVMLKVSGGAEVIKIRKRFYMNFFGNEGLHATDLVVGQSAQTPLNCRAAICHCSIRNGVSIIARYNMSQYVLVID